MHSNESAVGAPATGPALLSQLGRLVVRARSTSPAHAQRRRQKLIVDPSTSQQIQQCQPKPDAEPSPRVMAQLDSHVHALWSDHIPLVIEILLGPDCASCYAALCAEAEAGYDKPHAHAPRSLLLERWTMRVTPNKSEEAAPAITPHWLLNAVRSQLHFSQLSAWRATIQSTSEDKPAERRRKLSRETCNFKKVEANCDESDLERKLNLIYSIRLPGESYESAEFTRPPTEHRFPVTELGGARLAVRMESLPRLPHVPRVRCVCRPRRPSLPPPAPAPAPAPDDLAAQLGGLTLGPRPPDPVDDRMLTPCSESGKHRCSCDDESDTNRSPPSGGQPGEPDERRLREIAKYKRRLRKESKLRRLCDSTSSEGDGAKRETHTSIPILQAARFDRLRALGCLRRYAPPGRAEPRSPPAPRTRTVATQTDAPPCACGASGMRRSDGTSDLVALESGARRKRGEDDGPSTPKCDSSQCDSNLDNASFKSDIILKRPKLRRHFPPTDRIERVISDRLAQSADMRELNLRDDDSVFSAPRPEPKRQKTYSVGDDYVCYEKCDYGTVDELAGGAGGAEGAGGGGEVPSPTEVDRFRWRFDSAASMVFHHKTGLPLTSSPAPLRRGNTCFDFDDSINGVSGIKSALFHGPAPPSPPPAPPRAPRPRHGPSSGLLGSFEESALKGRLEPVATVAGFSAELGASGAFCPPHRRLPVTVFFYAPGGTNAPYMGHINLGAGGYRVARSGTIQVSLFNPHGTLVKMFVVLYDLTAMPPHARTFLRQRTLYMPAGAPPPTRDCNKWLRYLIHLRFMTSRSGKLYLHTDIRIIVSRKADLDTATAHSALFRSLAPPDGPTDELTDSDEKLTNGDEKLTNGDAKLKDGDDKLTNGDVKLTNGDVILKSDNEKLSNGSTDILVNGSTEKLTNGSAEKVNNGSVEKLSNGSVDKLTNHSADRVTDGSAVLTNGSAVSTNGNASLTNGVVTRAPNRVFGGCGESESSAGADVPYELRSFTYAPDNPRFSPR